MGNFDKEDYIDKNVSEINNQKLSKKEKQKPTIQPAHQESKPLFSKSFFFFFIQKCFSGSDFPKFSLNIYWLSYVPEKKNLLLNR